MQLLERVLADFPHLVANMRWLQNRKLSSNMQQLESINGELCNAAL